MKRPTVVLALALLSVSALAADKAGPRLISVVGTSQVKVEPDEAMVALGVDQTEKDLLAAKEEDDQAIRKVLQITKDFGVETKDVRTSEFSIAPQYDYPAQKGRQLTGYRVSNNISVTFKHLSKLSDFLAAVVQAGANTLQSVDFQSSDMEKYEAQARELAVKDARDQALSMAGALGEKIGRTWSISADNQEVRGGPVPMMAASVSLGQSDQGPVLAPGQLVIRQSVNVSFELR